jgi:hypothetical protein
VEGYSVCLWTEFGDCISGGRFDFVLFLPLFLIVVFSANRWHTRLRTHINTRLRRPNPSAFSQSSHSARSHPRRLHGQPDVIDSSLIDSGKIIRELSEFQTSRRYVVRVFLNLYTNSLFALEGLGLNMRTRTG